MISGSARLALMQHVIDLDHASGRACCELEAGDYSAAARNAERMLRDQMATDNEAWQFMRDVRPRMYHD